MEAYTPRILNRSGRESSIKKSGFIIFIVQVPPVPAAVVKRTWRYNLLSQNFTNRKTFIK